MKFLSALPLVKLAVDTKGVNEGSLYTTASSSHDMAYRLGNDGERRVMQSDDFLFFNYHDTHKYLLLEGESFLGIDCKGQLFLTTYPHHGFSLEDVPGQFWKKSLTYNNDKTFQVCQDRLIAYQSQCVGARNTTIFYEVSWPVLF